MKFGEILKEEREKLSLSVKKLSDLSGVSTAYISKLENNKRNYPSQDVIFNLASGLHEGMHNKFDFAMLGRKYEDEIVYNILDKFINADDTIFNNVDMYHLFERYKKFYDSKQASKYKLNIENKKQIFENKVLVDKKTNKYDVVDYPFLDLNWLLTQNEYEVFYGRNMIFNKKINHKGDINKGLDENEMFFYNKLDEKDIKTIKEIIDAFLSNKYVFYKDEKKLFEFLSDEKNSKDFKLHEFLELMHYNNED
ncbi:helix-turn-helix domain-containing protein [Macrococcoides bohemicum]|uniref:helix-turn-helix domain-containing protein n=1 Tax=Macrococcoides bohemicum TaxID=1903056 RepID=UPI001C60158B|nr:helix-turn-helix transcriptional regulator [Macrococcus bohemicus]QYA45452.1 helix-turn-helix domain-containing protein [Macrococcus bohemicus]